MIDAMRRDGTLREFNAAFNSRRLAAAARGEGFMTYAVASARLTRALIPMLVGKSTGPMRSIFEQVFGSVSV
jgi:hypothetical protein